MVAAPAIEIGRLASTQRNLIADVFGPHRSATVVDKPNPFVGKARVNVLLLNEALDPDLFGRALAPPPP